MLLDGKVIIAVDFDDTLAKTDYPTIIEPIYSTISYIKRKRQAGCIIILNTCRHDKDLTEAVDWCDNQGITFDYINENVPELIEMHGDCRKIAADIYIDDKAVSGVREDGRLYSRHLIDTCICCGAYVPEGHYVCKQCEMEAGVI